MTDKLQLDVMIRRLMTALAQEDKALVEARRQFDDARAQWEVASRKFAAVRDLAAERLGRNPYTVDPLEYDVTFVSEGRFAFLRMNPGDAAVEVLKISKDPMTLEELYEAIREGGFRAMTPRMLNAALMKTTGVMKSNDGKYEYEGPVEEDMPSE